MKKTLLIAAAALAAGVISSQAAPVYSQNIVGYVNQPFVGGAYTQITVPLSTTSSNIDTAEHFFPSIQSGDAILTWSGVQFDTYTYLAPDTWILPDQSIGLGPNLKVGQGIFYQAGVNQTNTFVGNVVLSNTNSPVSFVGGAYTLVGSVVPMGFATLENTNLNLPLQSGDAVLLWGGTSYNTYTYLAPDTWILPDQSIGTAPGISVGQGFFYQAGVNEQWSQNVQIQ